MESRRADHAQSGDQNRHGDARLGGTSLAMRQLAHVPHSACRWSDGWSCWSDLGIHALAPHRGTPKRFDSRRFGTATELTTGDRMRRILASTLPVLALVVLTAVVASAADAAPAKESTSLFTLYLHSMPVGGVLTILSFVCFSLALTWTFTMRAEDLIPPGVTDEIHALFAEGATDEALEQAKAVAAGSPSFLGNVLAAALDKKDYGHQAMCDAAEEVGVSEHSKYLSKVAWLSLFSSSATLLGLLGTVTGIIGAFLAMSQQANADPNSLAKSIGEALVCTAMGLVIAITGLYFFFFLRNRVNQAALDVGVYTKEILDYFRSDR